jgi:pimeloyl-ACP methyl ester carboxylesterase
MAEVTTSDGVRIAYDVTGTGPVLALVHGLTESRRAWDPLIDDLAADHTLVTLDVRGHGASSEGPRYDPPVLADDVAAVLADAGLADPLVVGHSMGGVIVTAFAAAHPARGVVNVDQPIELAGFQELVRSVEPLLRGDGFTDFIESLFATFYGPLPAEEVARLEALSHPVQEVVLGMWGPVLDLPPAELEEVVRSLTAGIHVPYLALHGDDPGATYGPWLQEAIPTATFEVWEGSGHYPHLLHPERFTARLRAFESTLA